MAYIYNSHIGSSFCLIFSFQNKARQLCPVTYIDIVWWGNGSAFRVSNELRQESGTSYRRQKTINYVTFAQSPAPSDTTATGICAKHIAVSRCDNTATTATTTTATDTAAASAPTPPAPSDPSGPPDSSASIGRFLAGSSFAGEAQTRSNEDTSHTDGRMFGC